MNLDPVLLRTFVAIHETGGFTRAAKRLHLTQPAVSHHIRRLEEEVGRPLLFRTTRRLTLTEDGQELLRHAEQILQSLDAVAQRFRSSPISGVVRFGVQESFMGERLTPLLCQFARAFPAVRLEVNVGPGMDFCEIIHSGEFDLAVILALPGKIKGTILRRTQFVWAAADFFQTAPGASLPMVFFPTPCVSRQVGVAALESAAVAWHSVFTSPSRDGLRSAVLAGLGVTVLPKEDLQPGMKIVDGHFGLPPLSEVYFTLIWNDQGVNAAAREFGQMIECMASTPAQPTPTPKKAHAKRAQPAE